MTFDGDPLNWDTFHDLFVAEVHGREDIPAVEKMIGLKGACVGDGLTALGPWPVLADSYPLAWAALCEKYDNQPMIKKRLVRRILHVPAMTHETS